MWTRARTRAGEVSDPKGIPADCKKRCSVCSGVIVFYDLGMTPKPAPEGPVTCKMCEGKKKP